MKTVKLSSLALLLSLVLVYSCTKESPATSEVSTESVARSSGETLSMARMAGPQTTVSKTITLTPSPVAQPVNAGDGFTVTYTATNSNGGPVQCGAVIIYQMINNAWVEVARAAAPAASVTIANAQQTGSCAYEFRAGFDPGAGSVNGTNCRGLYNGVDYLTQASFCVEVRRACVSEFTITAAPIVVQNMGNGVYEFTIKYILTSPVDVSNVKFQGGATAGGNANHFYITDFGNTQVVHNNNNNTVLQWNGNLTACTPQEVYFKYRRNFSCPATGALVTGNWSASTAGQVLGTILPLPYSCQ